MLNNQHGTLSATSSSSFGIVPGEIETGAWKGYALISRTVSSGHSCLRLTHEQRNMALIQFNLTCKH